MHLSAGCWGLVTLHHGSCSSNIASLLQRRRPPPQVSNRMQSRAHQAAAAIVAAAATRENVCLFLPPSFAPCCPSNRGPCERMHGTLQRRACQRSARMQRSWQQGSCGRAAQHVRLLASRRITAATSFLSPASPPSAVQEGPWRSCLRLKPRVAAAAAAAAAARQPSPSHQARLMCADKAIQITQ